MSTRYATSPIGPRRRKRGILRRIVNVRIFLLVGLIVGVVWVVKSLPSHSPTTHKSDIKTSPIKTKSTKLSKGTPDYTTYLPIGGTIDDYGGWTRVSPPKADPVYAYSDTINKVPIIVSQQRLPDSFKGHVDKSVEELATDYAATQKITAKNITIHIGRSSKGPESIIFVKGDTLILIKTERKIPDNQLLQYVELLK